MLVNTFPFFHSFPLSFAFSLEKVKWERERERENNKTCLSRSKDFRSELDWLPPLHFNPRKSPRATETDSVIALPAHRAFRRIGHEKRPRDESCWRGRRKGKRKKKMQKEKQEKREKEGRKKNNGSWLSSSEKEEASAMNCRAFMGGKMARRYFEEEKKSKRQHR